MLYLLGMKILGYHVSTPVMIGAIMLLCGERKILYILMISVGSSLFVSFVFESLLNVVLTGGIFDIHIPW